MRSGGDTDVTAAARIRDCAILLFGRDGFAATTVRAVAREAGVSPALVIHHFESKEGLRAACDEHLLTEWLRDKRAVADPERATASGSTLSQQMREWLADVDRFRPMIDYFARVILDDSDASQRLFDRMVDEVASMNDFQIAAGAMLEPSDRRMTAVMLTSYGLAPLLLQRRIGRHFGDEHLSSDIVRRMTIPVLEFFTRGLYADESLLEAARASLEGEPDTRRGPSSGKGDGEPHQDPDPPADRS